MLFFPAIHLLSVGKQNVVITMNRDIPILLASLIAIACKRGIWDTWLHCTYSQCYTPPVRLAIVFPSPVTHTHSTTRAQSTPLTIDLLPSDHFSIHSIEMIIFFFSFRFWIRIHDHFNCNCNDTTQTQMIAAKKWNWHEKLKHEKWNRIDIIYEFCARKKLNEEKKMDCCWSFVHTPISRYFMYICVKLCRHKVDNRTMSNGMAYNNNIYVRWPDDT